MAMSKFAALPDSKMHLRTFNFVVYKRAYHRHHQHHQYYYYKSNIPNGAML